MNKTYIKLYNRKIKAPLKIVLISDLHNRPYGEIIEAVKTCEADVIAVAGDLVDRYREKYDRMLGFLTELAEIAPTYFSYGNHEMAFPNASRAEIEATGAVLLDNSYVLFRDNYYIGGYTPFSDHSWLHDFEKLNGYKILLCHKPEHYYNKNIRDMDIDLILSGHAHGGQVRLFGRAIYAPGQGLFPRYTAGLYENRLIVSTGVANSVLIPRFFNPTEIVIVNIVKKQGYVSFNFKK